MNSDEIVQIIRHTLFTTLELGAPFLLLSLALGFLIGLFQMFSQIQEISIAFVPKMLLVTLAIALLFPWILKIMTKFTHTVWISEWEKITMSLMTYVF